MHTQGKIKINEYGTIEDESGQALAFALGTVYIAGSKEADANTRRLVAMWNALDGVPTEEIELMAKFLNEGMVELPKEVADRWFK